MKLTLLDLAAAKEFIEAVRPVLLSTVTPEMRAPFEAYMKLGDFRYKVDLLLAEHGVEVES